MFFVSLNFISYSYLYCYSEASETINWISEKKAAISTDVGSDLSSVEKLQRKHDALERDLAALSDKVCF